MTFIIVPVFGSEGWTIKIYLRRARKKNFFRSTPRYRTATKRERIRAVAGSDSEG